MNTAWRKKSWNFQTYALPRKVAKDRFTLYEAVKKFPGLKKYVRPSVARLQMQRRRCGALKESIIGQPIANIPVGELIAGALKEISDQSGLNININLEA